jgi:hypothetical protein
MKETVSLDRTSLSNFDSKSNCLSNFQKSSYILSILIMNPLESERQGDTGITKPLDSNVRGNSIAQFPNSESDGMETRGNAHGILRKEGWTGARDSDPDILCKRIGGERKGR